jgi:hypothetical protein
MQLQMRLCSSHLPKTQASLDDEMGTQITRQFACFSENQADSAGK